MIGTGSVKSFTLSSSSGSFATTSTSFVAVTNMSITFTVKDAFEWVWVGLISDGSTTRSVLSTTRTAGAPTGGFARYRILRGVSEIATQQIETNDTAATALTLKVPSSSLSHWDNPGAGGIYTYSLEAQASTNHNAGVEFAKLLAIGFRSE